MFKIEQDFKDWLNRYRYGNYNGIEITSQTEMVAYTYVISIIVITFRRNTRYYFKEAEKGKALAAKILCIFCNLIAGWWGIPWGPIWTVKETVSNLANMNVKYWGEFAGEPQTEDMATELPQKTQDVNKKTANKKIAVKDIVIYILIGLAIGVALIVADMNGML